jgi:hypothetical protein
MTAWFNKRNGKAIAKMAEILKAESKARAKAEERLRVEIATRAATERQVKAQAEQKLLTQHRRYSALAERVEAQAKEEIAKAKVQLHEALHNLNSYKTELKQKEEQLSEAQKQLKTETAAKVKAQESLNAERQERRKAEATEKEEIAKVRAQAEVKRIETKGQIQTEAQPANVINTFKLIHWYIFNPRNMKRKIALLSLLAIFSAITFALSVANGPSVAEFGLKMTQMESDTHVDQLTYNMVTGPFHGSLSGPAPRITYTPALNSNSADNVTLRVNDEKNVPILDTQSLPITANPTLLKITASADSKSKIVQSSDNNRWETNVSSYRSYEFSDVSIPVDAIIISVVLFVEHFEGERFAQGKLEWAVGTGWPNKPVIWAAIKAPINEGETNEAFDAWDVTSVVDTAEKINSLQLQIKNNNNVANGKTLVDYAYVVVEYD